MQETVSALQEEGRKKEIAEVSVERTTTEILAPQKVETEEVLVKTSQAGSSVINRTKGIAKLSCFPASLCQKLDPKTGATSTGAALAGAASSAVGAASTSRARAALT